MLKSSNSRLLLFFLLAFAAANSASADISSALLAMENSQNPLMRISTSKGEMYLELFAKEAPNNVANFIALAEGEKDFLHLDSGQIIQARYYDGMRFHRVLPGFVIQAGSPAYNPLGAQLEPLADEINADSLGLQLIPAINADGSFAESLNIESLADFHAEILTPIYVKQNIMDVDTALARQAQTLNTLKGLTVKSVYENQGYQYKSSLQSRGIERGIVAMANSGANSNAAEFFISLNNAHWLTGKYTVIGKVVEGLNVMDNIGNTAIDPAKFSSLSTLIYSVRRAN